MDDLNNTATDLIRMKPKDAIKLDEVPLVNRENYLEEDKLPGDGCIGTYYNLVKNMMIRGTEQLIGCGLGELTD